MNNDKHMMPTAAIFTDTFEPISNYHLQMVGSHIHWVEKLRKSIVNEKTPLNIETISKDDCCAFGKWLHSEHTRLHLGHFRRYQECVEKHAAFHIEAGKIAELVNKGEHDNALHALDGDSKFSRASIALVAAIFPLTPNPFFSGDYWKKKLRFPMQIHGSLPMIGSQAPIFYLANSELEEVTLASYSGRRKILNILPSLNVPDGMASVRKFNQHVASLENVIVLVISADLPSIQHCFFEVEVLHDDVVALSTFRTPTFATDYGVQITSGQLAGLMAPAVVVMDTKNKVIYTQLLSEMAREPNYEAIVEVLKRSEREALDLENLEKFEDLSAPLITPTMGASVDSLREHFRVDIPAASPCFCELVLPVPKDNATTEYKHAYVLAAHKIQNKIDEALRQQSATKIVSSRPCMRLNLHDVSASGCSIVNHDEEFSYFLQPHTIYRDCTIFVPNNDEAIVTFKIMSKHKMERSKVSGFNELIGIRFIGMQQPVEFMISRYVQELERQRISLLRESLPKQE